MKLERCKAVIQEIAAHVSTIEPDSSQHPSSEGDSGIVYREICSLNLVSCYSLSKGHAPILFTSGSIEPLRLYVLNEPKKKSMHPEAYLSAFLQITAEDAYPLELTFLFPKLYLDITSSCAKIKIVMVSFVLKDTPKSPS
jgi:hypothetical protein